MGDIQSSMSGPPRSACENRVLPAFAGWPLGTTRQHLAMRLACSACGHSGGVDQFVGSAWLELTVDELAEGWIEDIESASAGGSKATGELSLFGQQPQQHLLRDDQATLSLRIDDGAENSGSYIRTVSSKGFSPAGSGVTAGSAARSAASRRRGWWHRRGSRSVQRRALRAALRGRELKVGQMAVKRRLVDQLFRRASGGDPTTIHQKDPVGAHHRRQPVRNNNGCSVAH